MVETTIKLADAGKLDLAATFAASGLSIMGIQLKEGQRTTLLTIKSRALAGMVVSVSRSDRRFPLFQAQANYQIGRAEDAWQACLDHHALFPDSYRELDPNFSIWVINKLTEVGNYSDAEKYLALLFQWVDQAPQSFAPVDRVNLLLAFANIPFQRQEYPKAKAICEQILANKDFADVPERYDADLKIVEIDRLCKRYDAAIERLQKLLHQKPANFVRTGADYQMALANMNQAGYPDATVREKQTVANLPAQPTDPLPQVKSNTVPNVRAAPAVRPSLGELYVSSDEIVSKEERAQQEMDRKIRERVQRIAVEAGQTGAVSTIRAVE